MTGGGPCQTEGCDRDATPGYASCARCRVLARLNRIHGFSAGMLPDGITEPQAVGVERLIDEVRAATARLRTAIALAGGAPSVVSSQGDGTVTRTLRGGR